MKAPSRPGPSEPASALSCVIRCAGHLAISPAYCLVRDGLIEGHTSSATIVHAISTSLPEQRSFLRLVNWLIPGQDAIDQVGHAVNQLGLQCSHDLFLAASLHRMLHRLDEAAFRAFRRWSLSCGLAAHFAFRRQAQPESARPLLEGLLAPLGLLLLAQCEPQTMARIRSECDETRPLAEAIKNAFGFGHQAVAAELLRYWVAPAGLVQVLSMMQAPESAAPYQLEAANLNLAWQLAEAMQQGRDPESARDFAPAAAWAISGLHPFDLGQLAALVDTHRGGLAEALGWTD